MSNFDPISYDKAEKAIKHSKNVQEQLNQAIAAGEQLVEVQQARVDDTGVTHPTLNARITSDVTKLKNKNDEIVSQLAQKASREEMYNNANMYWIPPKQPSARKDTGDDYFIDIWSGTADSYINDYFEPLRSDFPDYITRTSLGKDASGEYDVWKYEFTPKSYSKTIILTSCMHGNELMPMVTMVRFLNYLLYDWDKYPQLAYLRNHVRIVYIPFVNPWGVSQNPRTRHNSNGVDLNRNFDYKWEECYSPPNPGDYGYKGVAPFSEKESQYVRDTLLKYSDAVAYLDMHNHGQPIADFIYYTPRNASNRPIFEKLVEYLSRNIPNPVIDTHETEMPTAHAYAWNVLKIPAANPEFPDGRFGNRKYDSIEVTKSLEWFSNLILQHVSNDNYKAEEPFVIEHSWATGSSTITLPNQSAEISELSFEFEAPCDGFVTYDVTLVLSKADDTSSYYLRPVVGQEGALYAFHEGLGGFNEVYTNGVVANRHILQARAQSRVLKTDGTIGKVKVGFFAHNSQGTCNIYRFNARTTFIPSKQKQRFQRYRKYDSNENWQDLTVY